MTCACICSHLCVCVCVCHVCIINWPLLPYIRQALPTIRHTAQVPDTPLNPLPGTLTASPWDADPEGLGKCFVHAHTLAGIIQTYAPHMHPCTHAYTVEELKDHIAFKQAWGISREARVSATPCWWKHCWSCLSHSYCSVLLTASPLLSASICLPLTHTYTHMCNSRGWNICTHKYVEVFYCYKVRIHWFFFTFVASLTASGGECWRFWTRSNNW